MQHPAVSARIEIGPSDEQQAIESELTSDHKEQAEHLMLVDLERNDLGRVAAPASVRVPDAFVLEQYSHVTHLVSHMDQHLTIIVRIDQTPDHTALVGPQ